MKSEKGGEIQLGVGKLNVYITALGQPCTIDNNPWVVAVGNCDGTILNWSEGRYKNTPDGPWIKIAPHVPPSYSGPPLPSGWWYESVPANNGHVEIEVPPGRYVIAASKHTWTKVVYENWYEKYALYGNWYTHKAIVNVGCGEDVCATLFSPTVQLCWQEIFEVMFPLILRSPQTLKMLKPDEVEKVKEAAKMINERLFKPLIAEQAPVFEKRHLTYLKSMAKDVKFE